MGQRSSRPPPSASGSAAPSPPPTPPGPIKTPGSSQPLVSTSSPSSSSSTSSSLSHTTAFEKPANAATLEELAQRHPRMARLILGKDKLEGRVVPRGKKIAGMVGAMVGLLIGYNLMIWAEQVMQRKQEDELLRRMVIEAEQLKARDRERAAGAAAREAS